MTRVSATDPADLPGLDALFRHGFGHGLDPEEWRWKYEAVPGRGRSVVARSDGGEILGHAGAVATSAIWEGRSAELWQLVDWVGRPGSGLRPPLVVAGRGLLAEIPGPDDVPWVYGFPSPRHYLLGARVFGYREAGRVEPWRGPTAPAAAPEPALEASDRADAGAEEAWRRCGLSTVERSVAFLNWRYHARPGRYYRFYGSADGPSLVVAAFVGSLARLVEIWIADESRRLDVLRGVAADLESSGIDTWEAWPPPPELGGTALLEDLGMEPTGESIIVSCRGRPDEPDCRCRAREIVYGMGDYDAA